MLLAYMWKTHFTFSAVGKNKNQNFNVSFRKDPSEENYFKTYNIKDWYNLTLKVSPGIFNDYLSKV